MHEQDGFRFDAGPTIITVPHLFEELWAAGRQASSRTTCTLKVARTRIYRVRFDDGRWFDYSGDNAAHMRAEVARFDPADLPGFDALAREGQTISPTARASRSCGPDGLRPAVAQFAGAPFLNDDPHEARLADRSGRCVKPPPARTRTLRVVFSFHPLLIGGNPLKVSEQPTR